ncbi:MAG: YopX family protein [Lactococcus sp.]|nr:YopX family protein [Lactococcus sp.]MDN6779896.1 YopX family protein [Lactobacillus sp.]MDN5410524.1 YopX family protein [Lactococcus sp.]MDN5412792.1 YopX family protein [Lactococcus sp.]MDN5437035.1 YopX family protein [Lactococcus sp.]MDN5462599.1 YopX family protein [Lactococcus sp.]
MIPKFRAFWKKDKIITNIDALFFLEGGIKVEDGCSHSEFLEDSSVSLMKSTGLVDKHGVDIFEGDIVKNGAGNIGYISYLIQEAGYVVVLHEADYRLGHRNTGETYGVSGNHEVIGNIYEDLELLRRKL